MTLDREEFEATPLDKAGEAVDKVEPETPVPAEEEIASEETPEVPADLEAEAATPEVTAEEPAPQTVEPEKKKTQETPAPKAEKPEREKESQGSHDDYSQTFRSLSEGDLVDGVVVHIDKDGVLVDVGTKSEGVIRLGELAQQPVQSAEEVVAVGDRINVYVMETDSHDGGLILSKKRADFEEAWDRVLEAHRGGKPVTAMVTDRVKGGLVVDLGIRGFVPASHVGGGNVKNLDRFVGQSLPLKIIEVDRERRKVILSHRQAVEGERDKRRSETLKTLSEGQVRDGAVRRITDYGAFVDLGGIDGLLHISEMSWTRINHPSEVVKVGQKIQVMILKLNLQQDRVSLGLRQILPDPWGDIAARYTEGDLVRGRVSRLVPFGAFVRLEGGIEGIIPNVELSRKRVKRADDVIGVGDEVEARVIDINREERRMTLSIRQVHEEKEKAEFDTYRSGARDETRTTLGDLIGDKLKEYRTQVVEHDDEGTGKKPERRKRRQSRKVEEDADEHVELDMIEEPVEEAEAPAAPEGVAAEPAPAPAEDVDETATEAVSEPVEVAAEAAPTESAESKAPAAEEEAGETA